MKKIIGGSLLLVLGLGGSYGAWAYWSVLTKAAVLMLGGLIGACLASGLLVLAWRPQHPATRYHEANLPSPYDRRGWR